MEIVDQSSLHNEVEGEATNSTLCWIGLRNEQIGCLIYVLQIGVACSAELPQDRMNEASLKGTAFNQGQLSWH